MTIFDLCLTQNLVILQIWWPRYHKTVTEGSLPTQFLIPTALFPAQELRPVTTTIPQRIERNEESDF